MKRFYLIAVYLVLIAMSAVSLFPFLWTIFGATHTNTQVFRLEDAFSVGSNLKNNYEGLLTFAPVWRNMWNSVFISGVYTLLVLLIDSMAGFAFAKYNFKGRETVFFVCLCSMFIPQQVTMIPLFVQMGKFNLVDNPFAVIFPSLSAVFGVFLMRQQFASFPNELLDSARIDGAGDFRVFFRIVAPSMKPAFASLGILSFVNQWGNFLWPLIILNAKERFTMPLVLSLMVQQGQVINYGAVLVGATMALLPVLIFFLAFQKNFINGMLSGAIKG